MGRKNLKRVECLQSFEKYLTQLYDNQEEGYQKDRYKEIIENLDCSEIENHVKKSLKKLGASWLRARNQMDTKYWCINSNIKNAHKVYANNLNATGNTRIRHNPRDLDPVRCKHYKTVIGILKSVGCDWRSLH